MPSHHFAWWSPREGLWGEAMRWASLILTLFVSGCFGCEQETKPEPEQRQMIGAWAMRVGHEVVIVTASAPVRPTTLTITIQENGKTVRREVRQ